MNSFYAFVERNPFAVPGALGAIFLSILVSLLYRALQLRKELLGAPERLAKWEPSEEAGAAEICEFIGVFLLRRTRVSLDGWPEERLFSSREATDLFEEYAERRLSTIRFALGSTATGIALFCTFYLIAHVLEANIPSALDAASAATADTEQLKTAMKLLGQKFLISATGILIAVVFAVGTAVVRRIALHAAHDASMRSAHLFCTPASLMASTQLLQLRAAQVSAEHLEEVRSTMSGTRDDLAKLRSIEVSVKDMGAEVTTQLQRMLKEDLEHRTV